MQNFDRWLKERVLNEWEFKDIFGFESQYPQFEKKEDDGKPFKKDDIPK